MNRTAGDNFSTGCNRTDNRDVAFWKNQRLTRANRFANDDRLERLPGLDGR
jgi:hypothetical protein